MKPFLVLTLTETSFVTPSYSWIFLVMSVNSANLVHKLLHFENVKIHKHFLYWKVFSTDIYIERFVSTVYFFFSHICWSVNCMSWVCKFNNFFMTCTETEARFAFEGFNVVLYGKFISDSLILFLFFYRVCKLFKGLFQSFSQSVSCMNWVFELWSIPRRCHVM